MRANVLIASRLAPTGEGQPVREKATLQGRCICRSLPASDRPGRANVLIASRLALRILEACLSLLFPAFAFIFAFCAVKFGEMKAFESFLSIDFI